MDTAHNMTMNPDASGARYLTPLRRHLILANSFYKYGTQVKPACRSA